MHRTYAAGFVMLTVMTAGCIHIGKGGVSASAPIPSSVLMESRTVDHSAPARPGQLTPQEVDSIAPSIRSLRAQPFEVTAFVGDTIRIADLVRVVALDSAGLALGEMPRYDFTYNGRGFRLLADGRVHLRRRGTVRFSASLPPRLWTGPKSKRPSTEVKIMVLERVR